MTGLWCVSFRRAAEWPWDSCGSSPSQAPTRRCAWLPSLGSRALLSLWLIHSGLCLLIPRSFYPLHHCPLCWPYVCFLRLLVCFCFVNELICTFLDSTRSDSMYVSFTGFLHLTRQSLCPSTLLQMTSFHSFLWLSSHRVFVPCVFMHSPVHGCWGFFRDIMLNSGVQILADSPYMKSLKQIDGDWK